MTDRGRSLLLLGKGKTKAGELQRYVAFFAVETPKRFERRVRSTPNLRVAEAREAALGDFPARLISAQAFARPETGGRGRGGPSTIAIPAIAALGPSDWTTTTVGARIGFLLVDVGGNTLLVYVEAPPSRFGAFSDNVREILETMSFE